MFKGSIVALITPFLDGAVDEKAFRSIVDWHVEQGTNGLVPCGTTGESPTLSHAEHDRVIEICVEQAAGRIPVMAGTGSNSTTEAIRLTKHAAEAGANGALVVTPYYNKPSQEGLYAHFLAIAEAVDIPIFVYNIPGRSVINMSDETLAKLAEHPNIAGVKDATGDIDRVTNMRRLAGPDFIQLTGEDGLALGFNAHGGVGCISVTANVAPKLCSQMQAATLAGDFATARDIMDRLMPVHQALFSEVSPQPVKYAASLLGLSTDEVRLPLVPASEAARQKVRAAMQSAGLLNA